MGTGRTRPSGGARIHPHTAMESRMMASGVKHGAKKAMETPVGAGEASRGTFAEGSDEGVWEGALCPLLSRRRGVLLWDASSRVLDAR